MVSKLHYTSVSSELLRILKILMAAEEFTDFRLVGGTALSLYRGHRESIDIDLFTDAQYGSIDFGAIDLFLRKTFPYVDRNEYSVGPGRSYYLGKNEPECIKLDLFYTESFISEVKIIDEIRLATEEEIIAMKIEVVSGGGRKKDFWDIHELMDDYSIEEMLSLHEERYPYGHDQKAIIINFSSFEKADNDFDPICLRGKYWELIKLDLIEFASSIDET
jgi:hypothetical protein